MRNPGLHDALRDFALEAAALLTADVKAGAELQFDLAEEPGRGPTLYRYRPCTSEYIEERWTRLRMMPTCERASEALGSGAASYLRMNGLPGVDAEPALLTMLERLYEDATGFEYPEERFERVYEEVEHTLYDGTVRAAVVAPLLGLELDERVDLGDGLALVPGEGYGAPPEAVWPDGGGPNALCVLERDQPSDAGHPLPEARSRFRRLVSALRLFKAGGVTLGPIAYARADSGGAWRPHPLAPAGRSRGAAWTVEPGEAAELRPFVELFDAADHDGQVAWALARFEMGVERIRDVEALSDYLLALQALLDGMEGAGRASLALRLAALCAEEQDRRAVQQRVEFAFSLERFVMAGGDAEAYLEEVDADPLHVLVLEMEEHLRAVLRDVVCGYLEPDLKGAADDILLRGNTGELEIRAADLRDESAGDESSGDESSGDESSGDESSDVSRQSSEPESEPELTPIVAEANETDDWRLTTDDSESDDPGVTRSTDWDEDPESYSAPV